MTELDVVQKARAFVASVGVQALPIDLEAYAKKANARIRREPLGPRESAETLTRPDGVHIMTVNSAEPVSRQNFSICHEIAHVILGLPSNHKEVLSWGYVKRDPNEWMCDLFAAELLMPFALWRKTAPDEEPSHALIDHMATAFNCSFPAAASRYAALATCPCAYVTMQRGKVRFAQISTPLRTVGAKIALRSPVPPGSIAQRLRDGGASRFDQGIVEQDIWFQDWDKGLEMSELSRHYHDADETVSLLWFPDVDLPEVEVNRFGQREVDDGGLAELDGQLPWPGKRRSK